MAPFIAAVIPLVPDASLGTRGLFSQQSAACFNLFERVKFISDQALPHFYSSCSDVQD